MDSLGFEASSWRRLSAASGVDFESRAEELLLGNPDSTSALTNLERWLHSTGNPGLYGEQILARPQEARKLLVLFGASQPLADSVIQNPEFGSLVFDPSEIATPRTKEEILQEGRRLLGSAAGSAHSLDRLRYLKQKHNFIISINDIATTWVQEVVWFALSDLAEGLLELACESTWKFFAAGKDLPETPPIGIVAFGKFGGRELNYSSDIDLAYVLEDEAGEEVERQCGRFCAQLGRALSDRMGRGALYRVDLRLRPYGGAGPLLSKLRTFENYYRLYAEAWEIQALIKSRICVGGGLKSRWEALVKDRAFGASLSDATLADVLGMRTRIEERADEQDLKRGSGGIRDVEFLCQTLQLVYGSKKPELQVGSTCAGLRALEITHVVDIGLAHALIAGYTFLRKLEHRVQLLGDQQTHSLPSNPLSRQKLGVLMGCRDWNQLEAMIEFHRRTIRSLYRSILKQQPETPGPREAVGAELGALAPSLFHWFDVLPESEAYYRSLAESEGALNRVRRILGMAPKLIEQFKISLQLTEMLLSGEIEEPFDPTARLGRLPLDASAQDVAEAFVKSSTMLQAQWVLGIESELGRLISQLCDALLVHCRNRFAPLLEILALGSYGERQMSPKSDMDLLLLTPGQQSGAEAQAQTFLNFILQLRRFGFDVQVDLRLRPDGKKGLLARSYDGFGAYEVSDMEIWERFALGHPRLVAGSEDALDLVRHAAFALSLTGERLTELVSMKTRIETERVQPQHISRDVKLGHGGLNDIEWIVHLLEMSDPANRVGTEAGTAERIRFLGRASALNAFEVDSLLAALDHLSNVRAWISLLLLTENLVPENPEKLERLAACCGAVDANEFLRLHEPVVSWVRTFFFETLSRVAQ